MLQYQVNDALLSVVEDELAIAKAELVETKRQLARMQFYLGRIRTAGSLGEANLIARAALSPENPIGHTEEGVELYEQFKVAEEQA